MHLPPAVPCFGYLMRNRWGVLRNRESRAWPANVNCDTVTHDCVSL